MPEAKKAEEPLNSCQVLEREFEFLHHDLSEEHHRLENADAREKALRVEVHKLPLDQRRAALCFSGGGIRSATFCLGVLQGLAQTGWLRHFHYLSTVSGGGYIGSWLSSWICRTGRLDAVLERLNPISGESSPEPRPVQRLRAYCNYLSPVWGLSIDLITLIATFLRNLVLHWAVLVPLLAAVLMLPRLHVALIELKATDFAVPLFWLALAIAVALIVFGIGYIVSDLPREDAHRPRYNLFLWCCFVPIFCAALLLSWAWSWYTHSLLTVSNAIPVEGELWQYALAGALLHCAGVAVGMILRKVRKTQSVGMLAARTRIGSAWDLILVIISGAGGGLVLYFLSTTLYSPEWLWKVVPDSFHHRELYAMFCVPSLLGSFWLGTTLYVGLARRNTSENDREWWARSGAWWLFACVGWIALNFLVIYGPQWALKLQNPELLGPWGGALGLLTSLYGYWSKEGERLSKGKSILATAGKTLFELAAFAFVLILLMAISFGISLYLEHFAEALQNPLIAKEPGTEASYAVALQYAEFTSLTGMLLVLAAFGAIASWFCGTNTFSLHSMYGNRLVRAYLGATRESRRPHLFTGFDPGDNVSMSELQNAMERVPRSERRLFHVVNIALNMVEASGDRLEWQQRKAASFTASPLHAGAASVGYQPANRYSSDAGISLARAMTISGAAASPSMGYHSSKMVAFVMTFFNIRLGWWLPNPGPAGRGAWQRSEPSHGLYSVVDEALARTTDQSDYVYLSDGGHFENLGLYEMVRRRCRGIVMVDAGCDPKYEFGDLENAVRKIRIDLGISIVFPDGLPTPLWVRSEIPGREHCHFACGTIRYSDVDGKCTDGSILYIKPVLSGDEPLDVTRYAAASQGKDSPFPHHSTADQFFDESQFESYRALGYHSVITNFPNAGAWPGPAPDGARDANEKVLAAVSIDGTGGGINLPPLPRGISEALRSWSQATLLGASITVGGVLGVSGTVALRDAQVVLKPGTEISINAKQIEALKDGIPLKSGEIPPEVKAKLDEQWAALVKAITDLQEALKTNRGSGPYVTDGSKDVLDAVNKLATAMQGKLDGAQFAALEARIKALEALIKGISVGGTSLNYTTDLQNIREAITGINNTIAKANISGLLGGIDTKLKDLQDTIQRTAPRSNVRGTAEGVVR